MYGVAQKNHGCTRPGRGEWAVSSAASVSVSGVRGVSVSGASGVIGVSVIGVSGVAKRKGHGCTLLPAGGSAASASSASAASAAAASQKRKKRSHTQCFWPFLSHDGFPPNPGFESFRGRSSFLNQRTDRKRKWTRTCEASPPEVGPCTAAGCPIPSGGRAAE